MLEIMLKKTRKITKILLFYMLKNYLKKPKFKLNNKRIIFTTIRNYYNSLSMGVSLSSLLKVESYILILLNGYSSKSIIFNSFLKKWFYLKVNL